MQSLVVQWFVFSGGSSCQSIPIAPLQGFLSHQDGIKYFDWHQNNIYKLGLVNQCRLNCSWPRDALTDEINTRLNAVVFTGTSIAKTTESIE